MLSFANVLVLRWKICDTCEKSLWIQQEGRNFAMPQTRGDCSTALKFESSETVHEGAFCRYVPREPSGTSFGGENAGTRLKETGELSTFTSWQFLPHSRQAAPILPKPNLQAPV